MSFRSIFLAMMLIFSAHAVRANDIKAAKKSSFKVKFKVEFIYMEEDGTQLDLGRVAGNINITSKNELGACTIKVSGIEEDIIHLCKLPEDTNLDWPEKFAISDDTFTTIAFQGLSILPPPKRLIAKKIFENSNIYINNKLVETRVVNQTTQGEFIIPFQDIKYSLEHPELLNRLTIKYSFKSIRRSRN